MSASLEMHRWCGHPDCDDHITLHVHLPDFNAMLTLENLVLSQAEDVGLFVVRAVNAHADLVKLLRSTSDMLSAVAGDMEDGGSLGDLRGKYVTALVDLRDDARDLLECFPLDTASTNE